MKKVLITTPSFGKFSREPVEILENAGFEVVRVKEHPISEEEELLPYIDDEVVAIINGLEPVGRGLMEAAKGLRVIAKHGAGVNNIDLEAAKEHQIYVANTPGANKEGVADFAFGLMLAVARKIPQADRSMREGEWNGFFGSSVYGRALGIIGMGAIGKCMAVRAEGFQMKILGYDPFWDEDFAREHGVIRCTLEDLLKEADYVTIHAPLMKATEHMIDAPQLAMMKTGSFLINAARGEIVNEKALYEALVSGHLAGAAIDAFTCEPVDSNEPILKLEQVVVSPHIASYNDEAMNSCSLYAAKNVVALLCQPKPEKKPNWVVVDAD